MIASLTLLLSSCSKQEEPEILEAPVKLENKKSAAESPETYLKERDQLDETVWANEVEAQEYEAVFTGLWDNIRNAEAPKKIDALSNFPFTGNLVMGTPNAPVQTELGVLVKDFNAQKTKALNQEQFLQLMGAFKAMKIELVQSEWHHSRFTPGNGDKAPESTISFSVHAEQAGTQTKFDLKGDIDVVWEKPTASESGSSPVADSLTLSKLTLKERTGGGSFRKVFEARHGPKDYTSGYPVIVYDLNNDGLSEIILIRWNRIYWNDGKGQFTPKNLLEHPMQVKESAIVSDFTGDGNPDIVTIGYDDGLLYLFEGSEAGQFTKPGVVCSDVVFETPTAMTTGDSDGDGDLDLWITQYKLSFRDGQMPTPYYDANDGPPSYYLLNDSKGAFTDATEVSGLAPLRNRRTYSASFIDLDADGDLDLLNLSDYAGLDLYENIGKGKYKLATDDYVDARHFFGMGHTFGDYNSDGLLDFYVIGMSSTTARRLDRLDLGREDRPDIHTMRGPMGYGNRLYYGTEEKKYYEDPVVAKAIARTGWSWGTTTFDFDLDGDQDIYVANGHRSGESCQDYCTTFWRHDIYTGDSEENPALLKVFASTLEDLNTEKISWNGYEKNVLLTNSEDRPERFMNNSFSLGAAFSYDSRSIVSDDLDGDGRPDLLVAQSVWDDRGGFHMVLNIVANTINPGEKRNWFAVRMRESTKPGYSPNGAKVSITDNLGRTQTRWIVTGDSYFAQHAAVAHFGLGQADTVESIEITWANGVSEKHIPEPGVNRNVFIRGGEL
jgi:hypothetical protein